MTLSRKTSNSSPSKKWIFSPILSWKKTETSFLWKKKFLISCSFLFLAGKEHYNFERKSWQTKRRLCQFHIKGWHWVAWSRPLLSQAINMNLNCGALILGTDINCFFYSRALSIFRWDGVCLKLKTSKKFLRGEISYLLPSRQEFIRSNLSEVRNHC